MDIKYQSIIKKMALKHKVSFNVMKAICESQFEFTSRKLKELDLKEVEDLSKVKTNFRFKGIGTLYASESLKRNIEKHGNKNKGD